MVEELRWVGPLLPPTNRINEAMGLCLTAIHLQVASFRNASFRTKGTPDWGYDLTIKGNSSASRILMVLATELAIKALYEGENKRQSPYGHNLMALYRMLSNEMQQRFQQAYSETRWVISYGNDICPSEEVLTASLPIENVLTEFADYFNQVRYRTESKYKEEVVGPSSPNEQCMYLATKAAWDICAQEGWHLQRPWQW